MESGLSKEAVITFDAAFKLKSDSEKSLNNKAVSLLNLNKPEEAIKELEKAIKLSQNNPTLLNNKAVTLIDLKR